MTAKRINKNTSVNTEVVEANANVNEIKEEKNMTKQNNITAFLNAERKQLEEQTGISMNRGAKASEKWANHSRVGLNEEILKSIEIVTVKKAGDEEQDIAPSFQRALKIEIEGAERPIMMYDHQFLYEDNKRVENINIFDVITNGDGNKGVYITVKNSALEKAPEDLTPDDLIINTLKENQRVWSPIKKEFTALAKQLELAEIPFNDEDKADIPSGMKVNIFVYEDTTLVEKMKKLKNKRTGKVEAKKCVEEKYFYNASFIAPEDVHDMKYGRAFTDSKNAAHRKEMQTLPGVVRYLESC